MRGTEGEFEQDDDDGTFEVVEDHPPDGPAVEGRGIVFVDDEVQHRARGLDAVVREGAVGVAGGAGLVSDALVESAEAGTVDDGAGAVEEDLQRDDAGLGSGVEGWGGDVEGGAELVSPEEEPFVGDGDGFLDVGPFLFSDAWVV